MDYLLKLLAIDIPSGTRLKDAELHFRGIIPWWAALLLLVLLLALVIALYLNEKARLGVAAPTPVIQTGSRFMPPPPTRFVS